MINLILTIANLALNRFQPAEKSVFNFLDRDQLKILGAKAKKETLKLAIFSLMLLAWAFVFCLAVTRLFHYVEAATAVYVDQNAMMLTLYGTLVFATVLSVIVFSSRLNQPVQTPSEWPQTENDEFQTAEFPHPVSHFLRGFRKSFRASQQAHPSTEPPNRSFRSTHPN